MLEYTIDQQQAQTRKVINKNMLIKKSIATLGIILSLFGCNPEPKHNDNQYVILADHMEEIREISYVDAKIICKKELNGTWVNLNELSDNDWHQIRYQYIDFFNSPMFLNSTIAQEREMAYSTLYFFAITSTTNPETLYLDVVPIFDTTFVPVGFNEQNIVRFENDYPNGPFNLSYNFLCKLNNN